MYINLYLKDGLGIEFTACKGELIPERAMTSFTVSDAYRYFAGQALLLTSQSRSRKEYLIPTKEQEQAQLQCLIDTLIWQINLISLADFNTIKCDFLMIWYWLTFLGHPVLWNQSIRNWKGATGACDTETSWVEAVRRGRSTTPNDMPQIGTCLMSVDDRRSPNSLCRRIRSSRRRIASSGDSAERRLKTRARRS